MDTNDLEIDPMFTMGKWPVNFNIPFIRPLIGPRTGRVFKSRQY